MRKNIVQTTTRDQLGRKIIPYDWYPGTIPENVHTQKSVYIDSSFGFTNFYSSHKKALSLGFASTYCDRATFISTGEGNIEVGAYSILNGCVIICSNHIQIGEYVMIAWGAVICDNYLGTDYDPEKRCKLMQNSAASKHRELPYSGASPITIENNVWIGFDAVIHPGTTIGHGSVIGSKSVISGTIPPYSVVVGNPGKIVKTLPPTDKAYFENEG